MRILAFCILLLAVLAGPSAFGLEVQCPAKADVWISAANREESDSNGGKSPRIKMKVWQEFGLLDFDVSALKGKRIEKAELHLAPAGGAVFGGKRGTDLRWFTVSTVSSPWVEGEGTSYSKDDKGKGATFNEASYKTRPWTTPGSKCFDVILGNGKTLRCDVDAGDPKNGWFVIPLDKRVVEALAAGASYGFMVMDGSTGVDRNCYVASRESKQAPYLTVTVADAPAKAPAAPANITLKPSLPDASVTEGAALVSLTVPESAFAYVVKVNGSELPRWQIPFAQKGGATQTFLLEHLPPDADVKLEIAAVDATGLQSPFATATGKSSPKVAVPALPVPAAPDATGAAPAIKDKLRVWAFPEICKLDPLTAKVVLETGMENAAAANSVWSAKAATVAVPAARGDIAGFQIALETLGGPVADAKVSVSGLDDIKAKLWRTWFVKIKKDWQAEYAIPMADGALSIPAPDNKIEGQKAGVVAVDLIVPPDAKPGERNGTIMVTAGGADVQLKLRVKVYGAAIPPEINFMPEMNCYRGPGEAGSPMFFDSFRLAHYHRCTINRVPHSHSGRTHEDWTPAVGADGRVTDWSRFDKNLGPLLDGSAFKDNPRAGVPVPVLYLPQNESWPLPMVPHYKPDAPTKGKDWKALHDIFAKPPEDAFDQVYKDAFVANVADFVKHAEEKGWTRTALQGYNNNKVQYNKDALQGTAWTMDEPYEYLDWHALLFYSRLFHKGAAGRTVAGLGGTAGQASSGTGGAKTAQFQYRGDISRPQWQGNCFDGLMETIYVGGDLFHMPALIKDHKRRMPTTVICYGGANNQDRANHETAAWCLKAYAYDADGVLPWQALGGDEAFDRGDNLDNGNSLIVDGSKRFGVNAIASFRIHAFRQGAQLCELLRLVEKKHGWGRAHSGALAAQFVPLGSEFRRAFVDEAAAVTFGAMNGDRFVQLKEALLKLLER
jgi:hypothetical protein